MTEDIQTAGTPTNTNSASSPAPAGQSDTTDWKARFTGMQREYNRLQERVQAMEKAQASLASEKAELQNQLNSVSVDYEGKLATAQGSTTSLQKELETAKSEAAKLQATLQQRDTRDNMRRTLSEKHGDLLPWFEAGFLNPFNDDGSPMDAESLETYTNRFRDMQGSRSQADFENAIKGSTPAVSGTPGKNPGGMTVNEMANFLNNPENAGHQDYAQIEEAYITAIEKDRDDSPAQTYIY